MFDFESLLMLPAIAALTVVMGMDNIISVAVITSRIQPDLRARTRAYGLGLALVSRLLVLAALLWIMRGSHFSFSVFHHEVVFRDVLKLAGGCFLVWKSGSQILDRGGQGQSDGAGASPALSARWAVLQILFADQAQSMDSLVTVVGMAPNVVIMITAIVIELGVILFGSTGVSRLISRYPSIQTLAVCALLLVGGTLISEGIGTPLPRRYVYSMMAFALFVEIINVRLGQRGAASCRATSNDSCSCPGGPRLQGS